MKTFPAILAALGITAVVAVGMLLIGANALFNPNAGPIFNSPSAGHTAPASNSGVVNVSANAASANTSVSTQQIAQLQSLVKQYQAREKQYQTELDQAAQKVNQANQQLSQANQTAQQYQNILVQLQQMGVIQVSTNGTITVNRFSGGSRSSTSTFNGDD